jgi:hypothetical protein
MSELENAKQQPAGSPAEEGALERAVAKNGGHLHADGSRGRPGCVRHHPPPPIPPLYAAGLWLCTAVAALAGHPARGGVRYLLLPASRERRGILPRSTGQCVRALSAIVLGTRVSPNRESEGGSAPGNQKENRHAGRSAS